jgi:hypothetical protein
MEISESLIRTIAFFDLFDFPLTAEEIQQNLYGTSRPTHIKEIKGVLGQLKEAGAVEEIRDYFVLKGRGSIIETRKSHKFIAEKFWGRVRLYGNYMRAVPFIRMIAVCNNLAYDNPSETSDIDLLVVVEPGRMWTARLILTLILQFFGVRRHGDHITGRFCLSFFLSTRAMNLESMALKPEDPYLAYWLKTLAPIDGLATYQEMLKLNAPWVLKNYGLKLTENKLNMFAEPERKLKKFLEWLLNGWLGDALENLLKRTFKKRTEGKAALLGTEANVVVTDDMLKFHNHDRRGEYAEKWNAKSVMPPPAPPLENKE